MKFTVEKNRDQAVVKALESLYDAFAQFEAIVKDREVQTNAGHKRTAEKIKDLLRANDVDMTNRVKLPIAPVAVAPVVPVEKVEEAEEEEGNFLAGDFAVKSEEDAPPALQEPALQEPAPADPEKPKKPKKND
jgi:hypothetical protein